MRPRGQAGFTLTELLVALAGVGLVLAGLATFFVAGQQSFLVGANQIEAQQNVRIAIARMIEEIRNAGNARAQAPPLPATCPPYGFCALANGQTATSFTLQNDWNGNGVIEPGVTVSVNGTQRDEQITYSFVGSQLLRQESAIDAAPVPLIGGIQALQFSYADETGAVTATTASIRTIVVSVTTSPETRQATTYDQGRVLVTMTDTARIRNR